MGTSLNKVSVIISNRNDAVMLAVTVRSILEEFKPISSPCEIVIADNSDDDIYKAISAGTFFSNKYKNIKILRQDFPCLFTARELAAVNSNSEYILCLDSHMIVGHDMILDLVNFMDRNINRNIAFAHAPVSWIYHHESNAKHDRSMDLDHVDAATWNGLYDKEKRITWKGMPWICRRNFFIDELNGYGALSKHKMAWPGDPHLGIKSLLLGYENWAVPTSPGIHIGPFPKEFDNQPKYRLYSKSGNYNNTITSILSTYILGGEEVLKKYGYKLYRTMFGSKYLNEKDFYSEVNKNIKLIKKLGQDEKAWLDERKIMTFEQLLATKPWDDIYNSNISALG